MIRLFWLVVCFFLASIANGQFLCFILRPSTVSSSDPQSDNSNPYVIEVSTQSYTPGDNITVTITTNQQNPQATFTEVYVAAADAIEKKNYFGNWLEQSPTYCDDRVISYNTTAPENIKTFTWQEPMGQSIPVGGFIFRATIVQEAVTYWGPNVESAVIQVSTFQCPENACNNGQCLPIGGSGTGFTCICNDGYTGVSCDQQITPMINPCDNTPCENGGTCIPLNDQNRDCQCPDGFLGESCEIPSVPDPCDSSPCQNGGTCVRETGPGYICTCMDGFEGINCTDAVPNPCDSSPCQNGGTCVRETGPGYICTCMDGFEGINCMDAVPNPCDSSPCQNGGTCVRQTGPGYICTCMDGFEGVNCMDAVPNPCDSSPCQNGGTCVRETGPGYICTCMDGFEGVNCMDAVPNPCDSSPCQNGGTCVRETGPGYICTCMDGFAGVNCTDAVPNPCDSSPCQNGGTCVREIGPGYICTCMDGFAGINCMNAADPCILQPCQNDGTCVNLNGGNFNCSCLEGFTGETCEIEGVLLTTSAFPTEASPRCERISIKDSIIKCNETNEILAEVCTLECDNGKVLSVAGHNTFTCNLTGNNPFWNPRPLGNICQATVDAVSRSQQMNVSITTTATNCSELNKIDVEIGPFFSNIVTKAINNFCKNMTNCQQKINFTLLPTMCSSAMNGGTRRRRQTQAGLEATVVIEVTTCLNDSSLETVITSLKNLVQNESVIPVNSSYTVELTDANKESITISDVIYTCGPGHGNLGDGTCVMCPPGTKEESGSCMLCPAGTYQNNGGKIECKSCTEGQEKKINTLPGATQFDDVCTVLISENPEKGLPIAVVAILILVASLAVCGFLILLRVIQVICCPQKKTAKKRSRSDNDARVDMESEPAVLGFTLSESDSSQQNFYEEDAAKAEDGDDERSEAYSVDAGYHGSSGNGEVPTPKDIDLISITDGSIDEDFELGQHTYDDPANLKKQGGNQNIEISSL
ncbi:Sushi, nidogen and EGF-like domain-containing protein 1 [Holothuria leucospilota]|uniref:Sushi, nidogen and EGF-like domain-containing protein 1 n=1 Tax=Holothuria leucospilota TaxID=206669 RepID=A0A9Q1BNS7_HOLLE|nr:Sushi, nidogen and EGF-like domain-containing protein 1 [Holothuria leucospilota]